MYTCVHVHMEARSPMPHPALYQFTQNDVCFSGSNLHSAFMYLGFLSSKWLPSSHRYLQTVSENPSAESSDLVELTAQYGEKM